LSSISSRIGGIMVSVLVSSTTMGSSHGRIKPKIIKLIFGASLVFTQQ